jgi:hypothetical protein
MTTAEVDAVRVRKATTSRAPRRNRQPDTTENHPHPFDPDSHDRRHRVRLNPEIRAARERDSPL